LKWIDREGLRASTSQQPPLPCEAVCVAKWQQHYAPVSQRIGPIEAQLYVDKHFTSELAQKKSFSIILTLFPFIPTN
jgi:hypothetical protein